jgi:hypothetical protein
MKKTLSRRTFENLSIVLLILGTFPFLLNSFFANPWTDDFGYSSTSRAMGFFQAQIYWYRQWTGRYFSTALLSINPMVYGHLRGYKLIPPVLIVSLLAAIFWLVHSLTENSRSFRQKLLFSLAVLFVYLDQMADVRPGLYWMAASITYQVAAILGLMFFSLIIQIKRGGGGTPNFFSGALAIITAVCLSGTNEVAVALLVSILFLIVMFDRIENKRFDCFLVSILVVTIIASCFALFAPGNRVRLAQSGNERDLFLAVGQSFKAAFAAITVWSSTPFVLLLTVWVARDAHKNPRLKALFKAIPPVTSLVVLFLLILISFFLHYWSTAFSPPRRVLNLVYLFFLIGWLLCAAVIVTRLDHQIFSPLRKLPLQISVTLSSIYLLILFSMGHSNFLLVTDDLVTGKALRYDKELERRYAQIKGNPSLDCEVGSLENTPMSLFFDDIKYENENWINKSYASYFGKRSIILKRVNGKSEGT